MVIIGLLEKGRSTLNNWSCGVYHSVVIQDGNGIDSCLGFRVWTPLFISGQGSKNHKL